MKRGWDFGMDGGMDMGAKQSRSGCGMAIKMLVSPKEAGTIIGKGGQTQKQIAEMSGCKLHLSGMNELYPGTQMQELCMRADTGDAVANGVLQILMKLSEETGKVMGGEWDVEDGGCRVHFVVPTMAARNLIGKGGENIKALRQASGMKVHVEEVVIGSGDVAEQVISLAGPLVSMQTALPMILEKVQEIATQSWFGNWAYNVMAAGGEGAAKGGKGGGGDKGKGKGGYGGGMDGGYDGGMGGGYGKAGGGCGKGMDGGFGKGMDGGFGKGMDGGYGPKGMGGGCGKGMDGPYGKGMDGGYGKGKGFDGGYGKGGGGGCGGCGGPPMGGKGQGKVDYPSQGSGAAATQENIDMLSTAVSAMPPGLASAADRSQVIQFNVPATYVSALIGKGGMGTKQIAMTTDTKIMIREIDGSQTEKAVVIKGNAINVASAYLHVASRLSNVVAHLGPLDGSGSEPYDPIAAMMGM